MANLNTESNFTTYSLEDPEVIEFLFKVDEDPRTNYLVNALIKIYTEEKSFISPEKYINKLCNW